MTLLKQIYFAVAFGLISCGDNRTETTAIHENMKADSIAVDSSSILNEAGVVVPDSIKRFTVDDYPVTNDMFRAEAGSNSSFEKRSGQTISFDKAWFKNDSLEQALVFELYTDYHRLVTYHFYYNDIPPEIISEMTLHIKGGELATEEQKQRDFYNFVEQAVMIGSSYFVTKKGLRLGDAEQKVIDQYGKPDKRSVKDEIEKLEWQFVGDEVYDGKSDLQGKPLARESFGHYVTMYFRDGRLIGLILFNDVP